ncbi:MAG: hypothetical protein PHF67_00475 [Candidatus Nanoarchaeia archaeon]|nr:hypothetical protein [Candidatus Nanoarchaeia archaeon]
MKVKRLIEILQKMDPERLVILSSDPQGKSPAPLNSVEDNASYNPSKRKVGFEKLDDELLALGYSQEDVVKGRKAIVLYPKQYYPKR